MENLQNQRREFIKKTLAGTVTIGAGMTFLAPLMESFAPYESLDDNDPNAKNEKEFRMGVIGPAQLSLETSQIATQKATQKNAKEFAGLSSRRLSRSQLS